MNSVFVHLCIRALVHWCNFTRPENEDGYASGKQAPKEQHWLFFFALALFSCQAPRPVTAPAARPFPSDTAELKAYLLPVEREKGYSPHTFREEGRPFHHPLLDTVFARAGWQTAYRVPIDGDSIPDWLLATYSGSHGPDQLLLSTSPEKPVSARRSSCMPALLLPTGNPGCPLLAIEAGLDHSRFPSRYFLDSIPLRWWRGLLIPCAIDTSRQMPFETIRAYEGGGLSRGFSELMIGTKGWFRFRRQRSYGPRKRISRKGELNAGEMETLSILLANLAWASGEGRPAHYSACMTDISTRTITAFLADGTRLQISDQQYYGTYLLRALADWAGKLE
ncbi:MAG: hypothetical protein KDD10_14505 [Phaeodactylibacter sp.]|nr:hypothetical protein [Phaeodactylibacter sp.]